LEGLGPALAEMVGNENGQLFLRVNRHAEILWFHREAFEELLRWMLLAWVSDGIVEDIEGGSANLAATAAVWETLIAAAECSEFQVAGFIKILIAANDLTASES
jgi:hypothetical protein